MGGHTTDRNDPDLKRIREDGQQEKYLVLSEEERAKGFVRPYRTSYIHTGLTPENPLRDLTAAELVRFKACGYVKFEAYPESEPSDISGRYWTAAQLMKCGAKTTMSQALSETYARDPKFYGATFCVGCQKHFPVNEFTWDGTDQTVGS